MEVNPPLHKKEIKTWVEHADAANSTACIIGGVGYPTRSLRFLEFIPLDYISETQCFTGHFAFDRKVEAAKFIRDFDWLTEKTNAQP